MDIVAAALAAAAAVLAADAALLAWRGLSTSRDAVSRLDGLDAGLDRVDDGLEAANMALNHLATVMNTVSVQNSQAAAAAQQRYDNVLRGMGQVADRVDGSRREMSQRLDGSREAVEGRLDKIRETVDGQLGAIRDDNGRKLEQIRETVDEKLTATLNDRLGASFKQVSDQLEAVYKGLGDMRSVASGVGDLKRVLSNVKTRGMLGEVQLGAILADVLAPDQYLTNVATKPGGAERVEFAVRIPVEGGEPVLLPIDAKFPGDTYSHLRDAIDAGDAGAVSAARRALVQTIRSEAKDISQKYLSVPETTNFGIMFLPFEGLYAEVAETPGLIEGLQRDYQVNVAGPSTMAVILNSLQMSYQTFAFQRQADEIQRVLSAVKAEFPKYQEELRRALRQIETAGKTVDGIINTRTNVIERKLRGVTAMEDGRAAADLLGIDPGAGLAEGDGRGLPGALEGEDE